MKIVNQNNLDSEKLQKEIKKRKIREKEQKEELEAYIKEAEAIPDLTVEKEKELFEKIAKNGDSEAIEKITKANLKLVVSIAKKYVGRNPNFTLLDLVQEGNLGLFKAINKFNIERAKIKNYTFEQYATLWIRQSISRSIVNEGRIFRVSKSK